MKDIKSYIELLIFILVPLFLVLFNVLSSDYRHLVLLFASFFLFFLALRRHWVYGLFTHINRGAVLVWGAVTLFCVLGILSWVFFTGNTFGGWTGRSYVIGYILLVSFLQEFVFRKYLHGLLSRLTDSSIVTVFTVSFLFGGMHLIYLEPFTAFLLSFLMSVMFSTAYIGYPSLFLASVSHAFVNYVAVGYCIVSLTSTGCL